MKTKKCSLCSRRFKLHDYLEENEKDDCFTCRNFKQMVKLMTTSMQVWADEKKIPVQILTAMKPK